VYHLVAALLIIIFLKKGVVQPRQGVFLFSWWWYMFMEHMVLRCVLLLFCRVQGCKFLQNSGYNSYVEDKN